MLYYREKTDMHQSAETFEINYVYRGSCQFDFEKKSMELHAGDLCIVTPDSRHNVKILEKGTFMIQEMLVRDTFYSAFINLLSDENMISRYFRAALLNSQASNYLLLSTGDAPEIRSIARNMYLEQYTYDTYSPQNSTNWLRLFFAYVLRRMDETNTFSMSGENVDIAPILKYLNVKYRTTTLQEVAEHFHYSPSYLSTVIRNMTGKTYTDLIRELKMIDARHLLEGSDKSVEEISALAGYNSADQFTRTFRSYYGMTPTAYRKNHRAKQ